MAAGNLASAYEKWPLCCPMSAVTTCMAFGTMCALPDAECQTALPVMAAVMSAGLNGRNASLLCSAPLMFPAPPVA